jgi:hypothetical protein
MSAFLFTRRVAWLLIAIGLAVALIYQLMERDGNWLGLVFLIVPDLSIFLSMSPGLERGQLHPRAVPVYNALHHPLVPIVLIAIALTGLLSGGWLTAGLAWLLHIAIDRVAGYGLRTREGIQRA